MIKYYCDLCGTECNESSSKMYENLQGDFGVEVVVLKGSLPVSGVHVCGGCTLKLFNSAIVKSGDPSILQMKLDRDTIEADRTYLDKLGNELFEKQAVLSAFEAKLKLQVEAFERSREEVTKAVKAEVDALKNENQILKDRELYKIKQADAQGYQRALDECNNPDYLESIKRRERLRGG